jgi:hypothetical protein
VKPAGIAKAEAVEAVEAVEAAEAASTKSPVYAAVADAVVAYSVLAPAALGVAVKVTVPVDAA